MTEPVGMAGTPEYVDSLGTHEIYGWHLKLGQSYRKLSP